MLKPLKHVWTRSTILIVALLLFAGALVTWKVVSIVDAADAAANQSEPAESIVSAITSQIAVYKSPGGGWENAPLPR